MTRKHFQAIAAAVQAARAAQLDVGGDPTTVNVTLDRVAGELATVCRAENPRFDRSKFMAACGVAYHA